MRTVVHPGKAAHQRLATVPCKAVAVEIDLEAGLSVGDAVARGLARKGFSSGYISLRGIALAPLHYVIPADAPDESHIAWYSETHRLPAARVQEAGCMVGYRDGAPFLHCHGLWSGNGGTQMGHLLPSESVVANDCKASGWGLVGAEMVARADDETNFTLFAPEAKAGDVSASQGRRAVLAVVRPNRDLIGAISEIAEHHGLSRFELHGIGSLVGCRLVSGNELDWHATEVLILEDDAARLQTAAIRPQVAAVDREGRIARGRLVAGENAVSVTFELLLVER